MKKNKVGYIPIAPLSAEPSIYNMPASNGMMAMGEAEAKLMELASNGPQYKRHDNYLHVTNVNGMRQAVQINLVINWMECDDGEHLLIQLREPDGNNAHDSLTVSKPSYDEMAELMREFNNRSY